jgi:hypothetical protein
MQSLVKAAAEDGPRVASRFVRGMWPADVALAHQWRTSNLPNDLIDLDNRPSASFEDNAVRPLEKRARSSGGTDEGLVNVVRGFESRCGRSILFVLYHQ